MSVDIDQTVSSKKDVSAVDVVMICDTMNEIDDQFAISYALGSEKVNVLGVISCQNTLVHGPNSTTIYKEEADRILSLADRSQTPSLKGAQFPMEHRSHGQNSEGLEFIVDLANSGTPFSILATGPATDVAALQLLHPEIANAIPVIWAGSFPDEVTWKKFKYGELNARADIHSWRVVYEEVKNLVVLPGWPGVAKVAVDPDSFVKELRELNHPLTDYLAEISEKWGAGKVKLDMDAGRKQKVLWDIVNVAYYAVPDAVTCEINPIPYVDAAGSMYWHQIMRNVPICLDTKPNMILEDLWKSLKSLI